MKIRLSLHQTASFLYYFWLECREKQLALGPRQTLEASDGAGVGGVTGRASPLARNPANFSVCDQDSAGAWRGEGGVSCAGLDWTGHSVAPESVSDRTPRRPWSRAPSLGLDLAQRWRLSSPQPTPTVALGGACQALSWVGKRRESRLSKIPGSRARTWRPSLLQAACQTLLSSAEMGRP